MVIYILDGNNEPIACTNSREFGEWFKEKANWTVEETVVGSVRVSTIFLSIDRNMMAGGPPVLWETMILGGFHEEYQERYTSRVDAVLGHQKAVALVNAGAPHGED